MSQHAGQKSGVQGLPGAVGKGDRFAALMQSNAGWVHAAARRQLPDPALADDAVQAVFLALWSKYPEPPGGGHNLRGWLAKTTRYVCNNLRVLARRRLAHERSAAARRAEQRILDTDHTKSQQLAALEAAMRRLPPDDQNILVARFYQGRSIREVGCLLGITEAAAKMRLIRAVKRLRTEMVTGNSPEDRRTSTPQAVAGLGIASLSATGKNLEVAKEKAAAPPGFRCAAFSGWPLRSWLAAASAVIAAPVIAVAVLPALLPSAPRQGISHAPQPSPQLVLVTIPTPRSAVPESSASSAHTSATPRITGQPSGWAIVRAIHNPHAMSAVRGFHKIAAERDAGNLADPNPVASRESTGTVMPP